MPACLLVRLGARNCLRPVCDAGVAAQAPTRPRCGSDLADDKPDGLQRKVIIDPGQLLEQLEAPFAFVREEPVHLAVLLRRRRVRHPLAASCRGQRGGRVPAMGALRHKRNQGKMEECV